jgi:hypothetical protein
MRTDSAVKNYEFGSVLLHERGGFGLSDWGPIKARE